jgi:23S rRNA maturation mini-RNase III
MTGRSDRGEEKDKRGWTLRFPRVSPDGIRLTSLGGTDKPWDQIDNTETFEEHIRRTREGLWEGMEDDSDGDMADEDEGMEHESDDFADQVLQAYEQADAFVKQIDALAKKGQVSAIIQGMVEYARFDLENVAKRGCEAIAGLAARNDETRVKVAAEGGIGAILGAMRKHPESEELQSLGCKALVQLAGMNADNQIEVAAEGGIGAILGAMRGHPESEAVQATGCLALTILGKSEAPGLLQVIKSAGAEEEVKRAMAVMESTKEMGQILLDMLKNI